MNTKTVNTYNVKSKIANFLERLEDLNYEIVEQLNKMLIDEQYESINDDVQFALDNNFCNGEHLLRGLLEVVEEMDLIPNCEEPSQEVKACNDTAIIMNEVHAVLGDTDFDFSDPDGIAEEICTPILSEWVNNPNFEYSYLSEFAVDWITKNILPRYSAITHRVELTVAQKLARCVAEYCSDWLDSESETPERHNVPFIRSVAMIESYGVMMDDTSDKLGVNALRHFYDVVNPWHKDVVVELLSEGFDDLSEEDVRRFYELYCEGF